METARQQQRKRRRLKDTAVFLLVSAMMIGSAWLGSSIHPSKNFTETPVAVSRYYVGHDQEVH